MLLLERWRIIYNYTKFGLFYKGFLQLSNPHLVHIIKPVIKVGGVAKFVINIFEIRFLILLTKTRTLLTRTINFNTICRKRECNSAQWDRHPEFITNDQALPYPTPAEAHVCVFCPMRSISSYGTCRSVVWRSLLIINNVDKFLLLKSPWIQYLSDCYYWRKLNSFKFCTVIFS